VLVGGQGTRLRPLTETVKKELLPLVDRAILHHNLDRLVRAGIEEVVMSSSYLEDAFSALVRERAGSPAVRWVTEPTPLDTGGAILHALDAIEDDTVVAMNGDVITDLDVADLAAAHAEHGAIATIAVHRVDDARAYGLVSTDTTGRVLGFLEKPSEPVAGDINAGTYVLDRAAFDAAPRGEPVSIEREVFPALIASGHPVFAIRGDAYWMDLGTPEKYLQATFDALDGRIRGTSYAAPYVERTADVDPSARVGRHVVVGPSARVGADAVVEESVLLAGAVVGARATVRRSILGPAAKVGPGAEVDRSVLGEGAETSADERLTDARRTAADRATGR